LCSKARSHEFEASLDPYVSKFAKRSDRIKICRLPNEWRGAQLRVGSFGRGGHDSAGDDGLFVTGKTSFFEKKSIFIHVFERLAAMANGAEVRLNGIEIGKVEKVDLSGEADPRLAVKVTMLVEADRLPQIPSIRRPPSGRRMCSVPSTSTSSAECGRDDQGGRDVEGHRHFFV
jgi:hypothetical protein